MDVNRKGKTCGLESSAMGERRKKQEAGKEGEREREYISDGKTKRRDSEGRQRRSRRDLVSQKVSQST